MFWNAITACESPTNVRIGHCPGTSRRSCGLRPGSASPAPGLSNAFNSLDSISTSQLLKPIRRFLVSLDEWDA